MSVHITSLVWEVDFPTQGQKLVMLRFADYANDEGASIWPANDQTARQCGLTKRGVQYILAGFRNVGLLRQTHEGGKGARDTNKYQIDVDLLIKLAYREQCLEGAKECLKLVEGKGELSAPYTLRRVHQAAIRVNSGTHKGEPQCTQTTMNHQLEPSNAQARALPEGAAHDALGEKPKPVERAITVCRGQLGGAGFDAWITWMRKNGHVDLADRADRLGKMVCVAKWPPEDPNVEISVPKVPRDKAPITDRIVGEGAA